MDSRRENTLKLEDLPLEIHLRIAKLAGAQGLINLKNTSSFFRSLQYDADGKVTKEYKKAIDELRLSLGHAALGEWELAKESWLEDPSLLTRYGTIHYPNKTYEEGKDPVNIPLSANPGTPKFTECTVWQIALMNEAYEEAAEMELFMSEEEKRKQFLEIFPDGKMQKEDFNLEYGKLLLQNAFDAIANDESLGKNNLTKMNQATKLALHKLYFYARPPMIAHQRGLVFDANFYLEAMKLYDVGKKGYKMKKRAAGGRLWSIRVEEWLAACLPTGYLHLHAQGHSKNKAQSRPGCVLADGSSYFAFRRKPYSIPGLHFFVSFDDGAPAGRQDQHIMKLLAGRAPRERAPQLEKHIKQKHEQRQRYEAAFAPKHRLSR